MVRAPREKMVTVRMSDEERAMLEELANEGGLSGSDVLRQLLRAAYRKRPAPAAKPPKRKR